VNLKEMEMRGWSSYNSSKQLVLSGSRAGVLRACEKLEYEQIAARAADLPVL
jgi:hypothetical protein